MSPKIVQRRLQVEILSLFTIVFEFEWTQSLQGLSVQEWQEV